MDICISCGEALCFPCSQVCSNCKKNANPPLSFIKVSREASMHDILELTCPICNAKCLNCVCGGIYIAIKTSQ